jgi:hypothetical protein
MMSSGLEVQRKLGEKKSFPILFGFYSNGFDLNSNDF